MKYLGMGTLTIRQDSRIARPKAARRVVPMDGHNEKEGTGLPRPHSP